MGATVMCAERPGWSSGRNPLPPGAMACRVRHGSEIGRRHDSYFKSARSARGMDRTERRSRVVVTGMGALTPLGLDVYSFWEGLTAGRSGVAPIALFDVEGLDVTIAGEVKQFDPLKFFEAKEARR